MTRMSDIPPELLAEMTPAVRAFIESLLVQMAEMQAQMQAEIDELKAQVKKLTPKNSSVPPFDSASACSTSGQSKIEIKEKTRRAERTQTHRSRTCSGPKMYGSDSIASDSMPTLWRGTQRD